MKNALTLLTILVIGSTFYSCSTDSELTKQELLTAKTWSISSKAISPSVSFGGVIISDISLLDSEEMAGLSFKYNPDGTIIQYAMDNEPIYEMTWSFNADETVLTHTPGLVFTYPMVGEISLTTITFESISANQLVATVPFLYAETNYIVTLTYHEK